ncbi:MAG: hypothetical protein GY814_08645 [Gammaproteobacteria bacterium]|nr:hypothetical protein [Gammaproteobacteria bacterium]
MGYMADVMYDAEMDSRIEFEDDILWLLDQGDDYLRKGTAKSRSPKIMSIRNWARPLTDKQRWCLAHWIWSNDQQKYGES